MRNKKPPFEITNQMIDYVAEIAELVGKLNGMNRLTANPTLRRSNRIRTIHGSLAIEQNTLSLEQVTAVLNGKHVLAPPKDIAEVKNAYEIYERLDVLDPYSVDDLLTAHGIMTRGLVEESGMFRTRPVGVVDSEGHVLHFGTLPQYIPDLVMELLEWVKTSEVHMLAVHTTLKDFMEEYKFVGWVRSNSTELNADLLKQINDMNNLISDLKKEKDRLRQELDDLNQSFESNLAFEGQLIQIEGKYQENYGRPGASHFVDRAVSKEITWDKMFILWAPYLIQTSNYYRAKQSLERALKDYMGHYFEMRDNLFQTIKIQYHALGLIKAFEANSTAGGTAEFISLTEKGKNYLIRKSAITKS